jgi:hypothetical protein
LRVFGTLRVAEWLDSAAVVSGTQHGGSLSLPEGGLQTRVAVEEGQARSKLLVGRVAGAGSKHFTSVSDALGPSQERIGWHRAAWAGCCHVEQDAVYAVEETLSCCVAASSGRSWAVLS